VKHSTERIRVSHAGNLPRPPEVERLLSEGNITDYNKALPEATDWIVDRQIELGVDIVNDGEYVKGGSFGGYIEERVSGFERKPVDPNNPPLRAGVGARDRRDFPGTYASGLWWSGSGGPIRPGFAKPGEIRMGGGSDTGLVRYCTGPVSYTAHDIIKQDAARLNASIQGKDVEGFIAALGPIGLGGGSTNAYYRSDEEYVTAVADAVREEYRAITDAGLILQIDEPNFLTAWMFYPDYTVEEYRKLLDGYVEVINYALEGIPMEQVRFHSCWGSGHRPHVHDIELKYLADILVKINAKSFSIESANVRHEHEWKVWKDVKFPEGRIYMPGVISHATDLVEHPQVVADRLVNYASVLGKENVQTGTDCGIGSRVGHEEIVWAKLEAMSEGARLASQMLWD
jgi:5-methyltetrahydropteroyltriglutamate--homocysteine methyltransferase